MLTKPVRGQGERKGREERRKRGGERGEARRMGIREKERGREGKEGERTDLSEKKRCKRDVERRSK